MNAAEKPHQENGVLQNACLRIKWFDRVTNETTRLKIELSRVPSLMTFIKIRKLGMFGHICSMSDERIVKTALMGLYGHSRRLGHPSRK